MRPHTLARVAPRVARTCTAGHHDRRRPGPRDPDPVTSSPPWAWPWHSGITGRSCPGRPPRAGHLSPRKDHRQGRSLRSRLRRRYAQPLTVISPRQRPGTCREDGEESRGMCNYAQHRRAEGGRERATKGYETVPHRDARTRIVAPASTGAQNDPGTSVHGQPVSA
jgi:hypothetical protein